MSVKEHTLTPRLIKKLWLVLLLIIIMMGACYVLITGYFANKYFQATAQRINAGVAGHLIEEKFQQASPFLEDGGVNKALFGDIMHDMMAVNRSIEVYLLDEAGTILYSVVLDHSEDAPVKQVSLEPIEEFINSGGKHFIMGDDPRNPERNKIFSAARFSADSRSGYIYIILAGKEFEAISSSLLGTYFLKLGLGTTVLTMIFASLIGFLSIWFLTKNLRLLTRTVKRFQQGDLEARIQAPENSDIEVFAEAFNDMADTIVENIDKIRAADTQRRDLIANVSHDLRTPLAILKGYVETLQMKKNDLSDSQKEEYLQITHDNIDKLSRLIDQLFEYSKLEAEQVTPKLEPFSITELSHDLVAKFRLIAEVQNIHLELKNPEENLMVFADLGLVERALQNLIENALKFTDPGGQVSLSLIRAEENVEITIADTGKGIPLSEQPYIFDRYRQVDRRSVKQGNGLGLAIVKKILELHNSTIRVKSKPERGSSFIFNLPAY